MIEERNNCLGISPVVEDEFRIDVVDSPEGIRVILEGEIDLKDPASILEPFFNSLHLLIVEKKIKKVEANFCNLTFLSSGGIKQLINWVLNINELKEVDSYTLKIIYSKHIVWQTISLKMVDSLSSSVITEEKEG